MLIDRRCVGRAELEPQLPLLRRCLEAIGVDFVGAPGFEAEDVIATWTAQARGVVEIFNPMRNGN